MPRGPPEAAVLQGPVGGTSEQEAYLEQLSHELTITPEYLKKICQHFMSEMRKGLDRDHQTVAMIPSFVEGRLTGRKPLTPYKPCRLNFLT